MCRKSVCIIKGSVMSQGGVFESNRIESYRGLIIIAAVRSLRYPT